MDPRPPFKTTDVALASGDGAAASGKGRDDCFLSISTIPAASSGRSKKSSIVLDEEKFKGFSEEEKIISLTLYSLAAIARDCLDNTLYDVEYDEEKAKKKFIRADEYLRFLNGDSRVKIRASSSKSYMPQGLPSDSLYLDEDCLIRNNLREFSESDQDMIFARRIALISVVRDLIRSSFQLLDITFREDGLRGLTRVEADKVSLPLIRFKRPIEDSAAEEEEFKRQQAELRGEYRENFRVQFSYLDPHFDPLTTPPRRVPKDLMRSPGTPFSPGRGTPLRAKTGSGEEFILFSPRSSQVKASLDDSEDDYDSVGSFEEDHFYESDAIKPSLISEYYPYTGEDTENLLYNLTLIGVLREDQCREGKKILIGNFISCEGASDVIPYSMALEVENEREFLRHFLNDFYERMYDVFEDKVFTEDFAKSLCQVSMQISTEETTGRESLQARCLDIIDDYLDRQISAATAILEGVVAEEDAAAVLNTSSQTPTPDIDRVAVSGSPVAVSAHPVSSLTIVSNIPSV